MPARAAFGIPGLDEVLGGGLSTGHCFLLEGQPGTGKTTTALQFLLEGVRAGERGLYITLSETEKELREGAASHGWTLGEGLSVFELAPPESLLDQRQQQSVLYSSELELGETTKLVFEAIDRVGPQRVVLDSLSEIRLLAQSSLRYRRQILALKHFFARRGMTVLLLDDLTAESRDKTVHSVVHGVINLEELAPSYGSERRRLRVTKLRGQAFRGGFHDYRIVKGGVRVFPRLEALRQRTDFARDTLATGIAELDVLLGGGVQRGSSTLLLGPPGAGKSVFAFQFVKQAIARGESAAAFIFDEEIGIFRSRALSQGFDIDGATASGQLHVEQVDAAELSPGEFSQKVLDTAAGSRMRTIVIDSLNGYALAMPNENDLLLHFHELLMFLNRQGANTIVTLSQQGLIGDMRSPIDLSYLTDTIILLRYFELLGRVRRAVSVIKKRTGPHETTIREFGINDQGLYLGEPLSALQGIMRGTPEYRGAESPLAPGKPAQ
jgi:circadian clock protein KaiC